MPRNPSKGEPRRPPTRGNEGLRVKKQRSAKQEDDPILPGVNPAAEDHATPDESLPYPIVAIGASAGGLEAYKQFLSAMPEKTGVAFVVLQHLDPKHHSLLTEILQRSTKIPVYEVRQGMQPEA